MGLTSLVVAERKNYLKASEYFFWSRLPQLFLTELLDDGGDPCAASIQCKSRGFDWQKNGGGTEAKERIGDGRTAL